MEEIVRAPHRPLAVLAVFVIAGPLIGATIALLPLAPFIILAGALEGTRLLAWGYPLGVIPAALTGVMANIAIAKWPRPAFAPTCAIVGAVASGAWALINTQSSALAAWLPFSMFGAVAGLGGAAIVHLLGLRGRERAKVKAPPPPGPGPRLSMRAGDVLLIVLGVVMAVMVATLLLPALV
ncbi:MAG: hypothetical protein C0481_18380 [Phenylobacterium sp.]|uniref:hypothetical protein n=1 Tax=Phenylobacterium sp. TaxID=1871053 RepID=UPI0025EB70F8|nr:hypothetical protein [Phenylobacterium sp.]MBA4013834.1 hypothetical protein [Phenylobacterium sp.]